MQEQKREGIYEYKVNIKTITIKKKLREFNEIQQTTKELQMIKKTLFTAFYQPTTDFFEIKPQKVFYF